MSESTPSNESSPAPGTAARAGRVHPLLLKESLSGSQGPLAFQARPTGWRRIRQWWRDSSMLVRLPTVMMALILLGNLGVYIIRHTTASGPGTPPAGRYDPLNDGPPPTQHIDKCWVDDRGMTHLTFTVTNNDDVAHDYSVIGRRGTTMLAPDEIFDLAPGATTHGEVKGALGASGESCSLNIE